MGVLGGGRVGLVGGKGSHLEEERLLRVVLYRVTNERSGQRRQDVGQVVVVAGVVGAP